MRKLSEGLLLVVAFAIPWENLVIFEQLGSLVRVLKDWEFDSAPVVLLVPTRKGRTARVQALIEFLEASFGSSP